MLMEHLWKLDHGSEHSGVLSVQGTLIQVAIYSYIQQQMTFVTVAGKLTCTIMRGRIKGTGSGLYSEAMQLCNSCGFIEIGA